MQPFNPTVDSFEAGGPARLVLVGPPGTGKTRASLDHFILPALRACAPDKVLACSFSNAAADELRTRLGVALGVGPERLRETCSTIHSEALRRYKRFGDPNPKLYDPLSGTSKPLKREFGPDEITATSGGDLRSQACGAWDYIRAVLKHKEPRYGGWCNTFARQPNTGLDLEAVIERFEQEKANQNAIDFTDMLLRALNYEGRELDLLLVDECQDCTPLQWALIDHWAKLAARVVLVGDYDQCIHQWCGADYQALLSRVRSPDWQTRVLDQSYRVPRSAHSAARYIVGRIEDREDAEYLPRAHDGEVLRRTEAEVIDALHALCAEYVNAPDPELEPNAPPPRSAFVLCRTNMMVSGMRKALNNAAVPYPFAPATAMRVRAVIDLCRDGKAQTLHAQKMIEKLPAAFFVGKKKDALEAASRLQDAYATPEMLHLKPSDIGTMIDALQGISGDRGYWQAVVARYPSWILTEPPAIEVRTMHDSKGAEADFVFLNATKPASVRVVDDAELRVLYVACTRTRDKLWIFNTQGSYYEELVEAAAQADLQGVVF